MTSVSCTRDFTPADALKQLRLLNKQGVLEFSLTFATENKLSFKDVRKAKIIMYYSLLTLDGTRMLLCTKSDPLQQPQRHNNSKQILWTRYKLHTVILKAYMQ